MQEKSLKSIIGVIAAVIFFLGAGFIVVQFGNKGNDNTTADANQTAVANIPLNNNSAPAPVPVTQVPVVVTKETSGKVTPPIVTPPKSSSPYADGTYSATGSYDSPAGMESILVSVSLKNGIIQSTNVTNEAQDGTSSRYQNRFISGYQSYVIGKNIASLSLGRVSGSSLTPIGFNQAIAKIKTQATA